MHKILRIVENAAAEKSTCKQTHTHIQWTRKKVHNLHLTIGHYWIGIFFTWILGSNSLFCCSISIANSVYCYYYFCCWLVSIWMCFYLSMKSPFFRRGFKLGVCLQPNFEEEHHWKKHQNGYLSGWQIFCTAVVLFFLSFSLLLCAWCCFLFFSAVCNCFVWFGFGLVLYFLMQSMIMLFSVCCVLLCECLHALIMNHSSRVGWIYILSSACACIPATTMKTPLIFFAFPENHLIYTFFIHNEWHYITPSQAYLNFLTELHKIKLRYEFMNCLIGWLKFGKIDELMLVNWIDAKSKFRLIEM